MPVEQVRALLPLAVSYRRTGRTAASSRQAQTPHQLALYLGLLDTDFEIIDPPELAEAFVRLPSGTGSEPSRR